MKHWSSFQRSVWLSCLVVSLLCAAMPLVCWLLLVLSDPYFIHVTRAYLGSGVMNGIEFQLLPLAITLLLPKLPLAQSGWQSRLLRVAMLGLLFGQIALLKCCITAVSLEYAGTAEVSLVVLTALVLAFWDGPVLAVGETLREGRIGGV
ncbi:MAG: hypothetical protein H7A35_11660 [Planctomycetales bacterium]|nr:hypothetical protein [bacterium]UNM07515.1 MAG: hypothetical protein H7A35_11660 [Planctomycetales bacterium]